MEQLESTRQLAPAATAEPCSTSEHTAPPVQDTAREPAAPRYAPAGGAGAPHPPLGRLCGSALAREELANTSYGQLVALVGELQRTVGEQKADIADLEEALRESKTAVRTLRGQAKETELRRYAAAADAAGLRRTASILPGPRTLQPGWPSIFATCDGSMALDPSAVPAEGAELLPQIGSAVSLESAPHHDPKDTSNGAASPLAGSLNGWPVDGSDGVRYRMPADRASIASPEMAAATAAGPAVAPGSPLSPSPQSVPARLPYKDSFASALGGSFESGGGGSLRKPRRLRTMVANDPRRLFSKMKRA
ncbi:hypothetical protein IWQ56_007463 [Coemansia nantahalensis]|nr:hypothetical protein IWQ56_007463 [Coemansia nantahalensis]